MANQLCDPAQLRCRLYVADLPREIRVSSQTRHNISLAVKEAVHNAIKHARASEVSLRIALEDLALTVTVQDDGAGFDPARDTAGNGLHNMKRRLESIGGTCEITSRPGGQGTQVCLRLVVKPLD
jgi:signal transduction histidine kinase